MPRLTPRTSPAGDSFQGHRRIGGHFYALRTSKLVWADDGALVIGDSEANGGAEAVRPVSAATVTAIDAAGSDAEPTIQGHRRVNGSFYSRKGKTLIWADTGEPVRARK